MSNAPASDAVSPCATPLWALSIRQPWAWLIANGYKDVENRRWLTRYRGTFAIHAALTPDTEFVKRFRDVLATVPLPETLECGGIVGVGELVDCVTESDSPWFCGPYGFVVAEATPVPFKPLAGRLNFFRVHDVLAESTPCRPRAQAMPDDGVYA
jgi:hypothetical protein